MTKEKLEFWVNVNNELKRQNKTQIEMCEYCHFSLSSIRNRISLNSVPNVIDAFKIADFLHVSLEYLITGHETQAKNIDLEKMQDALNEILQICQKAINEN